MRIWLTRHGQTNLNKQRLMQGLTDEPLNETGIAQAKAARKKIEGMVFDAVYASPLDRAIQTASIIGGVDRESVIIDPRIIEADFGRFEKSKYYLMGPAMTLYWAWPERIPAPKTVESIPSMVKRSSDFLKELEAKGYEDVLVTCHGGIIRSLCGYLEDRENGIKWRPKPHNCEIRVYESLNGKHRFIGMIGSDTEPVGELLQAVKVSAARAEQKQVDRKAAKQKQSDHAGTGQPVCACCGAPIEERRTVCETCGWEDDPVQNRDPEFVGGANADSLNEYRRKYLEGKTGTVR
ncbi:MAG: histidine phosphatase family protein [Lachnospiraceae bacterium]|nr:histidine phosphatase family protein [Lachnospiraceae bacterium]